MAADTALRALAKSAKRRGLHKWSRNASSYRQTTPTADAVKHMKLFRKRRALRSWGILTYSSVDLEQLCSQQRRDRLLHSFSLWQSRAQAKKAASKLAAEHATMQRNVSGLRAFKRHQKERRRVKPVSREVVERKKRAAAVDRWQKRALERLKGQRLMQRGIRFLLSRRLLAFELWAAAESLQGSKQEKGRLHARMRRKASAMRSFQRLEQRELPNDDGSIALERCTKRRGLRAWRRNADRYPNVHELTSPERLRLLRFIKRRCLRRWNSIAEGRAMLADAARHYVLGRLLAAMTMWEEAALRRKDHKLLADAASRALARSAKRRGMRRWRRNADKRLMNIASRAHWKQRSTAKAFDRLFDVAERRMLHQRLSQQVRYQKKRRSLRRWSRNSDSYRQGISADHAANHMKRFRMRCVLRSWAVGAHTTAEDVRIRNALRKLAVAAFRRRASLAVWRAWRDLQQKRSRKLNLIQGSVWHMQLMRLSRGWGVWLEMVTACRKKLRLRDLSDQLMRRHKLLHGWSAWVEMVVMLRGSQYLLNDRLARGMGAWLDRVAKRCQKLRLMQRGSLFMLSHRLLVGWSAWQEMAADSLASLQQRASVFARWQQIRRLAAGWYALARACATPNSTYWSCTSLEELIASAESTAAAAEVKAQAMASRVATPLLASRPETPETALDLTSPLESDLTGAEDELQRWLALSAFVMSALCALAALLVRQTRVTGSSTRMSDADRPPPPSHTFGAHHATRAVRARAVRIGLAGVSVATRLHGAAKGGAAVIALGWHEVQALANATQLQAARDSAAPVRLHTRHRALHALEAEPDALLVAVASALLAVFWPTITPIIIRNVRIAVVSSHTALVHVQRTLLRTIPSIAVGHLSKVRASMGAAAKALQAAATSRARAAAQAAAAKRLKDAAAKQAAEMKAVAVAMEAAERKAAEMARVTAEQAARRAAADATKAAAKEAAEQAVRRRAADATKAAVEKAAQVKAAAAAQQVAERAAAKHAAQRAVALKAAAEKAATERAAARATAKAKVVAEQAAQRKAADAAKAEAARARAAVMKTAEQAKAAAEKVAQRKAAEMKAAASAKEAAQLKVAEAAKVAADRAARQKAADAAKAAAKEAADQAASGLAIALRCEAIALGCIPRT